MPGRRKNDDCGPIFLNLTRKEYRQLRGALLIAMHHATTLKSYKNLEDLLAHTEGQASV